MARAVSSPPLLTELRAGHPEWAAYLALVGLALEEVEAPVWRDAVPPLDGAASGHPLLSGAAVRISDRMVTRWVREVLNRAAAEFPAVRPLAEAVHTGRLVAARVFEAALAGIPERLDALCLDDGAEAAGLQSLAPLIGMPLWQACRRAWAARIPPAWGSGQCPICGAWPAMAEIRGLENSRRLRCGQCGADWQSQWLRCPFCNTDDHTRLGALVLPDPSASRRVDICRACQGYIKTITTLSPTPPEAVMLQDLATLVLDVAAIEQGYRRPPPARQAPPRVVAVSPPLFGLLRGRS